MGCRATRNAQGFIVKILKNTINANKETLFWGGSRDHGTCVYVAARLATGMIETHSD